MKKHIKNQVNKLLFYLKEKIETISKKKKTIYLSFFLIMLVLYFGTHYKNIFFITLLTVAGALSLIYVRFFKEAYVLGVELVMFSTILCGYVYGSLVGFIVGFITIFISQIYSGRFKFSTLISIIMVPIIGLIVPFFNFVQISTLGIVLVIVYDLIILPLYYITGSRITTVIVYFITHILFNVWVFRYIAPFVLKLML
ncbi:hypothetical protein JXB41_02175 [Candidatus Woesearchaeota archaeon]|nr:hypothetical protein [Candidatus Woesearchaeota archaeon]